MKVGGMDGPCPRARLAPAGACDEANAKSAALKRAPHILSKR